jgi:hypothetical protein
VSDDEDRLHAIESPPSGLCEFFRPYFGISMPA